MPWTGRYYYRNVRVNGKPRRKYVGFGKLGQLAEQFDALGRQQRLSRKNEADQSKFEAEEIDSELLAFERLTDTLARAALVAVGCHQHHRGEWRRKREPK